MIDFRFRPFLVVAIYGKATYGKGIHGKVVYGKARNDKDIWQCHVAAAAPRSRDAREELKLFSGALPWKNEPENVRKMPKRSARKFCAFSLADPLNLCFFVILDAGMIIVDNVSYDLGCVCLSLTL